MNIKILTYKNEFKMKNNVERHIITYETKTEKREKIKKINDIYSGTSFELIEEKSIIPNWMIRNLKDYGNCLMLNGNERLFTKNLDYCIEFKGKIDRNTVENELKDCGIKKFEFVRCNSSFDWICKVKR